MIQLERMLYASTATGRTDSLLNMATILAESDRNNARDGLTGALAAHAGQFLQVIEGQPEVLDSLLRRLESDPRHKEIRLLDRTRITHRRFSNWTMANARITPALEDVLETVVHNPQVNADETIETLFQASQPA